MENVVVHLLSGSSKIWITDKIEIMIAVLIFLSRFFCFLVCLFKQILVLLNVLVLKKKKR